MQTLRTVSITTRISAIDILSLRDATDANSLSTWTLMTPPRAQLLFGAIRPGVIARK